jgi:hypothetical protein
MDERNKSRVVFHVNASLDYNGRTINGEVDNLSINGMYVNTEEKIPVDKEVEVSIYLSGTTSELSLKINGIIIRQDDKGVAVKFTQIGFDSYVHLRSIIDFNKLDENKIIKEFEDTFVEE